ncbi:hypothetical protein C6499_19225 [Candidatus Poribacteria bacterium]|nr:MAG: hypothetical protein C6499_19225 [Candidatus Poribacteria bacterium]
MSERVADCNQDDDSHDDSKDADESWRRWVKVYHHASHILLAGQERNVKMLRNLSLNLLLILSLFVSACSPPVISVTEHQKVTFNKDSTITIAAETMKLKRFRYELEHALLARGYNIVTREVAIMKSKLDVDLDLNDKKVVGDLESYHVTELNSVYSLTLYHDSTVIYGTLTDLRTGHLVKSLKVAPNFQPLSTVCQMLIDRMEGLTHEPNTRVETPKLSRLSLVLGVTALFLLMAIMLSD